MPKEQDESLSAFDVASKAFDELAAKAESPETDVETTVATEPVKPEAIETEVAKAERARDDKGRFSKAEGEAKPAETAKPAADAKPQDQQPSKDVAPAQQQVKPTEQAPVAGAPPPGWSVAAKAAWDALPKPVQEAIAKREKEVSDGFAQYQGANIKALTPYVEMATRSGTTLHEALERYTNLESTLRRDPARGLIAVAENMGWTQQQAAQAFANLASQLGFAMAPTHQNGAGQPNGAGAPQNGALDPSVHAALQPVLTELNSLKSTLTRQQDADQTRQMQSVNEVVAEFAAKPEHRYYTNVEQLISQLLNSGVVRRTGDFRRDLATAYEQACKLHPEVHEALINERLTKTEAERKAKEQEVADKAKKASRSVSGSPAPGTVVKDGDDDGKEDARSIAARAYDQLAARV